MEARRRTMALAPDGPAGNALPPSSIPVPTSTIKKAPLRAPAARMSMAPSAQAQGYGGVTKPSGAGAGGMSQSGSQENLRRSTLLPSAPGQVGPGRMSRVDVGGPMVGQTPQSNRNLGVVSSVRRQSTFPSVSRPSMLPSSSTYTTRDTRPVRNSAFQTACRENLEQFCRLHRCPLPIHERSFTSPTQKDFFTLFRWLISEFLDPAYPFLAKNPGDDIMAVLKDLKYPGLDNISKTALGAPGSGTNWGTLLAMLNWLVDLAKALQSWHDPNVIDDPLLSRGAELPLEHPLLEERLLWDFISTMYVQWFRGEGEEFPEAQQQLVDAYDRIQQASIEEADALETIVQKRSIELQQLQAQEPPLKALEDEYLRLMSDKTKFLAFIDLHKQKADKIRQAIAKAKAFINDYEQQLEVARSELNSIEAAVAIQNLSPDEVQRMNHERETLSRQLEDLRTKISEASQQSYDQEMAVTRSMDRFEQLVGDYTALGHQIGTIPPVSEGIMLGPNGVDYTVDIDLGMEDLAEIQAVGKRLRAEIWPALQSYGETWRKEVVEIENGNIALDDENDRLGQKVERQKEEAANLEMRLKVVHDQAEEAKSALQTETTTTNQTVAKLEHEVANVLMHTQRGVQDLKSDIETKRIEFDELQHKTHNLRDSIQKELTAHIDVVIRAKQHASTQMKGVKAIAEAQS